MGACSLCSDRGSGLSHYKFITEDIDLADDDPPALRWTTKRESSTDTNDSVTLGHSVILGQQSQESNIVSSSIMVGDPANRLARNKINQVENVPVFEKSVSFLIDDLIIPDAPNFKSDSEHSEKEVGVTSVLRKQTETKTGSSSQWKASNSKSSEIKEHSENAIEFSSLLRDETGSKKRRTSFQDKASNSTSTETKKSNLLSDIEKKNRLFNDLDEAKVDEVSQFSYARDEVSPMIKLPSVRRGTYVYRVKTDEELIHEMLYGDDSSDSPI